jgi:hypothetical protein
VPGSVRLPRIRSRHALAIALAFAMAVPFLALIAPRGMAASPEILVGKNRIGEFQGIRGDNYIAWQQNYRQDPTQYDVFARPIDAGEAFKINRRGTKAANGGIDGDMLVYQQFGQGRSDLRLYDLRKRVPKTPPKGVNTPQWEYWPSMSNRLLLFGRLSANGIRRIILFDMDTRQFKVLDKLRGADSFLAPGQIDGDWATWSRCPANGRCDVIRYHIPDQQQDVIPNPGLQQRAASIDPDGTVYFAQAKTACGGGVRLMSLALDGTKTVLWRLPTGDDIGTTHAYVDATGGLSLYFDEYDCAQAAVSDVWQIVEPGTRPSTSPTSGSGGTGSPSPSPSPSPTGSTGPTGPTAPTGPTGPTAPTGGTGPT